MNINKLFSYRLGLLSTCAALGVLSALAILPAAENSARAAENTASISVNAKPMLSISGATDVDMTITPSMSATFSSSSTTLGVKTNNPTGYAVYVNTKNNQPTLAHESSSTTINAIAATTDGITSANFAANTWGFAIGNVAPSATTLYKPVPGAISEPTVTTATIATNDTYHLAFGAAVDTTIPSGNYSNTVIVSVIANPIPVVMSEISTMQEMTTAFCTDVDEGSSAQLTDTRDGKTYWATKLKDGKCWMTQNLALDLSTSTTLTSADTNLPDNVTFTPGYNTEKDTTTSSNNNADTRSWSYHNGKIVLNKPNSGSYYSSWSDTMPMNYVTDVSGMTPDYVATGTGTDLDPIDEANNKYDAHYLIGNYYQFNAATAGTGAAATASGANATGSICPKGWRLPTSGGTSGEFQKLMTAYGMTNSTVNALSESPLYFVRGGYVNSGDVGYVGNSGYYWSSTSTSATNAYYLHFYSGYLYPSFNGRRYRGSSVRCVAE